MVRVLLIIMMLFNLSYAVDKAAVITAIKANPALLNTPQAEKAMKEQGLSKEQILAKMNGQEKSIKEKIRRADNNISVFNSSIMYENNETNGEQNSTSTNRDDFNPFSYIPEKKLIEETQSRRQLTNDTTSLHRYAEKFFQNKNRFDSSTMAVPEYYRLNIGDMITIYIYGGEDKKLSLTVDKYGNVELPLLGPIKVLGLNIEEIKRLIDVKLSPTYLNSKILVQVKVNSSIQVNLTGYIPAPGVYNLPSLSTIKDLLIAAHGVGKIGSIRNISLKRDGKLLKIVDFYTLIKDGEVVDTTLLRDGDVIYIPRAKKLVSLDGDAYLKAIYEMKKGEKLEDLIAFSGGLRPDASDKYIKIQRFEKNSFMKVFMKSLKSDFGLLNGDKVFLYKISQINKREVYVYGNIDKPGSYPMPKDGSLKTLLGQLQYLKNTSYVYALLKRFDDSVLSFNIKEPQDIKLKMQDTLYIFNKYQIDANKFVSIKGDVVKHTGKYRYLKGETLQDLIRNAGINGLYNTHKVQIVRWASGSPVLVFIDYEKNPNFTLEAYDEVTLFDETYFNPLKWISVTGEVNKEDMYVYSKNMQLKDAITMAGWFNAKANKNYIEVTRHIVEGNHRERKFYNLSDANLSFILEPFDEVSVKKIINWNERKSVTLEGEVKYPGKYIIKSGDTLYDVLQRAGGFTEEAYLYASVFSRVSIRELQQKRLTTMLYKLKRKSAIIAASAKGAGEGSLDTQSLLGAIDGLIKDAKEYKPVGRIALKLDANLTKFKTSPYNIVLKDGDKLVVPGKPNSIIVTGEVLNESAFVYDADDAESYIEQAGGVTADASEVYFVVHANGFSEKGDLDSWIGGDVKDLLPGDVVVVPLYIKTSTWYGISNDLASVVYKLAITAASLKTVGAF